ncbi:MAG: hypothetical protein R2876_03790 [Eubacteriales bacterium]
MKFKIFKSIVSVFAVAALLLFPTPTTISKASENTVYSSTAALNQGDATISNKEEVVYATLGSDGSASAIYVVNHFDVTKAGTITDYGNYTSVENLTTTDPLTNNKDSVSFSTNEGDFYYQGNMSSTDLPWIFNISYYLDGAKKEPQELAGVSGDIEMHITTEQNEKVNSIFYENYMLQISITLDTEKCENINAPGATIASSGKNTIITYIVMPGKNGDITLTSSVNDFAMSGIQVSAMPLNIGIELPDTDEMVDEMATLSDAISDLNEGIKDFKDGIADMNEGIAKLKDGSSEFNEGLSLLSSSSAQLVQASSQINSALAQIVYSLNNSSSGFDLSALSQLPSALTQLSEGLSDISGGLTQLKNSIADANGALDTAISGIPDISQSDIDALSNSSAIAGLSEYQMNTFNQLLQAYTAAQTVKTVYYGPNGNDGVKTAFGSAVTGLETMAGSIDTISQSLSDMSTQISNADISNQVQQLIDGLTALSNNYSQFHSGLIEYTDGVNELSLNYDTLNDALALLSNGSADLYAGVKELYDGSSELNDNVADLPETLQAEIDNLIKDYDKSDFAPASFVSEKNENVSLVQFVFKTADIESEQETVTNESESDNATFWDRFLALFIPND